jgi:hypothetical protein
MSASGRWDNVYPAGLQDAAENVFRGLAGNYPDADVDLILGRPSGSSADPRGVGANSLEKAVHVAPADLDARIAELRKAINAEKARIASAYVAANQRPPAGFLTSPEQHPDAPQLRELEAEAEHYRDKANDVTEHDLSEHYMNQARDYEDRASKLRSAIERSI